jgi:hypothetical protein
LPLDTLIDFLSIMPGRHLSQPAENHAEIALIAETDFEANFGYGDVR